jgi:hypothetical protein
MFEFSVSKDMKKEDIMKEGGNWEGGGTFMSNTDCHKIEN